MRRLFHRWFIEYNPLYLLSAALVLSGVYLVSNALLEAGHVYAELGGPAIAEAYAWLLVGGAALLMRVGLRRPAVMLALIAVLYQGDLTLHTETCAYLGGVGWLASGVWLASFVLKLVALARAMRLRVSRSAFAVPVFGAAGLVIVPRLMALAGGHAAVAIACSWAFALFALGLSTSRAIDFELGLDEWGRTVLRRARTATWAIWGGLAALHVLFWFNAQKLDPAPLVVVPLLLATRFVRREGLAWLAIGSTLLFVACTMPAFLSASAALTVLAFAMRVRRNVRALAGALFAAHLAIWTAGWSGGPLPAHAWPLDVALAACLALLAWKVRVRAELVPLAAIVAHWAVQTRTVTAPVTALEWGVWSVVAGFVLLVGSIGASVRLQLLDPP